jgi:cytochrome c-type biogenesis protein CcmE
VRGVEEVAHMNRYLIFAITVTVILGTTAWLGFYQGDFGFHKSAEYFVKIPELKQMDQKARSRRLLAEGYVREGSIASTGNATSFTLVEHDGEANSGDAELGETLKVIYTGNDLPAAFSEHDQALARGQLSGDGVLRADQIVVRCAWTSAALPNCLAAKYDPAKPVTIKGTVIKMQWARTSPHPWLLIAVGGADGKTLEWKCETASRNALFRQGWIPDSLKTGEEVTTEGFQAKDNSATLIAKLVTTANGKRMYTAYPGLGN